jgi:hypothetical protein
MPEIRKVGKINSSMKLTFFCLYVLFMPAIDCLFIRMSALNAKKVAIVGATGYIGKYVVRESVRRGYDTIAIVR